MASLFQNDSSDDDFNDNLQLAERLRLNRGNKSGSFLKKNYKDELSSSSSSVEMHNDLHKAGTSRACVHNKKRQNGDKNMDLLANPKRTCLSNRISKNEYQNKKSVNYQTSDATYCSPKSSIKNLFPDKTYEDHLHNLMDKRNPASNSSKQYSKQSIFNDSSDIDEGACSTELSSMDYSKHHNCMPNGVSKRSNPNKDSAKQLPWGIMESGTGRQVRISKAKVVKPISHSDQNLSDQNKGDSAADNNIVHYVDSASDDESKPLMKNGSLKGGRQLPETLQNHSKVIGRKVKQKVLDSDDDTEDDEWFTGNRARPRLRFSSDSDEESDSLIVCKKKSNLLKKKNVKFPVDDNVNSTEPFQCPVPKEPQGNGYIPERSVSGHSSVSHLISPSRVFRARKHMKYTVPINNFQQQFIRSPGIVARGRSRGSVGERYARAGSPHPRPLLNSHPRLQRSELQKADKDRSLTGSHSKRANVNLATTYPDLFDAEDDSSEVEFFTANSYSDTENSAESFGGLRISTTVTRPETDRVICEHSVNVGSSEDEISVIFSTCSHNDLRPLDLSNNSRRGRRALGRRRQRGSWRHLHNNVQEVVSLSPDPVEQVRQVEEDERFARLLQAQFDAEVDHDYIPRPADDSPTVILSMASTPSDDTDTDLMDLPEPTDYSDMHWNLQTPYLRDMDYLEHRARNLPIRLQRQLPIQSAFSSLVYQNGRNLRNRRRQPSDPRLVAHGIFDRNIAQLFNLRDMLSSDDSYEAFLGLADMNGDVPRGLQKSEINRLPTRKFVTMNPDSNMSEMPHKRAGLNKECQVCLTDYENGDTLRILPCFHEFHTPCIDPWLKINHTCPVCRVVVDLNN